MLSLVTRYLVFSFLCLLNAMQLHAEAPKWREEQNKDGIRVATASREGSPYRAFRGEVVIDAGLNSLMAVLDDTDGFTRWMFNCKEARLIYKPSLLDRYQYLVNDFPWPAADREMLIRNRISQDPETRVVSVSLEAYAAESLPESVRGRLPAGKGLVRVEELAGHFVLTPLADSRTAVEFQLHLDPNGDLPAGIVNALIVENPYETLKGLRELATLPKYQHFNPF